MGCLLNVRFRLVSWHRENRVCAGDTAESFNFATESGEVGECDMHYTKRRNSYACARIESVWGIKTRCRITPADGKILRQEKRVQNFNSKFDALRRIDASEGVL